MEVFERIIAELEAQGSPRQALELGRFFKTGPGEYGEGDRFLGVRVPVTRAVVKEFWQSATLSDVSALLASPWHEVRLAGFLTLVNFYGRAARKARKGDATEADNVLRYYLEHIDRGNNWDLVDLVAPKILGEYLVDHPGDERRLLDGLAGRDDSLWHRRVAIVSTWTLIRCGRYGSALRLSERFLTESHDLMHKATGWMLREVGKHGGRAELLGFLDRYAAVMPRTALRYAIEHLDDETRHHYMSRKRVLAK